MNTFIAEIRNNALPNLRVPPGTFVVWHNTDTIAHSAETRTSARDYFTAGAMFPGQYSTPIHFDHEMETSYLCRFHTGMEAKVIVTDDVDTPSVDYDCRCGPQCTCGPDCSCGMNCSCGRGGHEHHLQHYHGFVTGGRSGDRLYMTHTPVLADTRHNYQVILRGRFANPDQKEIYEKLREGPYANQVMQIFHDHMEMAKIGSGEITVLPDASVSYWPDGSKTAIGLEKVDIEGLEHVPVVIDEVLHFHRFNTEAEYPPELTYILYGDAEDVFIDHYIDRAPSFHSVARLAAPPEGWEPGTVRTFTVPGKAVRNLEPPEVMRRAIVDNAFNVYWLLPPGFLARQSQDPLILRAPQNDTHVHDIRFEHGRLSAIEISDFLHFDLRLLNYGVLIV